jgi:hypothetical protein
VAERLPIADGRAAAVLGLAVLDEIADASAARDEIRRVLAPGGRFVHLLDLAPNLDETFAALDAAGEVPLPNFFADVAGGRPPRVAPGPLDDLLAAPRHELAFVIAALADARHPLARPLGAYLAPFTPEAFDPARARAHYLRVVSEPAEGRAFKAALSALWTTLGKPPYDRALPLALRPLSTPLAFRDRAVALLDGAFTVELAEVVSARARMPGPPSFEARWVGRELRGREAPPEPLGLPVERLGLEAAPSTGDAVREAGVLAIVARRT